MNDEPFIIDSGTLYANPHPADWAINAYYSRIIEMTPDELLCIYRRAAAMYADDGRSYVLRSRDNGSTWIDEGCVYDGAGDETHYSYSATNITKLRDGTLVLTGLRVHRPEADMPVYNAVTRGSVRHESVWFRSSDRGRTWTGPRVIEKTDRPYLKAYGAVVELNDGRWLIPFDRGKVWDDPEPLHQYVVGLISSNRGETWHEQVRIAGGPDSERSFWHARVIKLNDDRLMAFAWTGDREATRFLPLHRIVGDRDGRHWGRPQPVGIRGQTNHAVDLGNGRMAIVVTIRESDHPGIYVALSDDEGLHWRDASMVRIWDAYGQESLGVPRTETYPASHDHIAFGAPDAVRLYNGDIMTSFWCSQQGQIVCRWCRLRLRTGTASQ